MTKLAAILCGILMAHALLLGLIYFAVFTHSPPAPLALVGLSAFQLFVAIAVWFGIKLRIGGPYRHICRAALLLLVLIDLAIWVRYGGVRAGHLIELGVPIVASSICFLAYSSAFVRTALPGHCDHCGYDLAGSVTPICPECGRCNSDRLEIDPLRLKICAVFLAAPNGVKDPVANIDLSPFDVRVLENVEFEQNPPSCPGRSVEIRDVDQRVWVYQLWGVRENRPCIGIQTYDGARTSLDLLIRVHDTLVNAGYAPEDRSEIQLYREILGERRLVE